ncbi:winged helix DNA-binding domain-containing protein [Micromonospora sp. NPDC005367]|uniref:winged helix DNA-binding domain-containing protein n=1 Tax=Micromonospora sp. NPDC005367 TaxID=3155590 RepID=UPI0033B55232
MRLTTSAALALRMISLLLRPHPGTRPSTVAEVVEWFGAMQAQDLSSGLWSLGARLPARTLLDVQAALERREALRTWPMRGTVHLVPARDARWMLELTGIRALPGAASRRATLGLDPTDADRAVEVLGGALAGGGRLTRAQCLAELNAAGIGTDGQRGYHLLWYASVRGVTCLAPNVGTEQTFALLDEWAPDPLRPERDEALAILTRRYVRSHGPVTAREFAGCSTRSVEGISVL